MNVEVQQADVTKLEVDAIANAANTRLMHGGGVLFVSHLVHCVGDILGLAWLSNRL